jgi:hypothetical protein
MKALNIMLQEASWVSTPSVVLADRLAQYAKKVKVILPMWIGIIRFGINQDKSEHNSIWVGWELLLIAKIC